MSEDHLVGHCGKILPRGRLCYPPMHDDFCPCCPLNGDEFEHEQIRDDDPVLSQCCYCDVEYGSDFCKGCPEYDGSGAY